MAKKVNLKPTAYGSLSRRVNTKLSSSFKTEAGSSLLSQIKSGKNEYLKVERIVNNTGDNAWIKEIEDCLFDLGAIVQNPKRVTQQVNDVVPVELARKTNGESITHLSTHSQYVKEMKENGEVIPSKILNIGSDDFFQTYENRFIATLIRKLVLFVEKRYQFLVENSEIKKTQVLMVKNKSIIDGKEVEIETKIKVSSDEKADPAVVQNKAYLARVLQVKRYLLYYYNSPFMQLMKTEKNVRNPILLTNILRKNPEYNRCYNLYRFIEKYELLGIDFKVKDNYSSFEESEIESLNSLMASNFLALKPEEGLYNPTSKRKIYKPKVVKSVDDDKFVYGHYYRGPMEFVRADDTYLTYLDALKKPTPVHPTKAERAYYGDELALNLEIKNELKEIAALLARKKKEDNQTQKEFDRIIEDREREMLEYLAEQARLQDEDILSKLEQARQDLINQALPDEEAKDTVKKVDPFEKLKGRVSLDFLDRIDKSEPELIDAYNKIRHAALCYGLHSRISKKCESFRLHNNTYVKITQVGKCLKVHYALDIKNYKDSPIPLTDEGNKKAYAETPLTLKVKSPLSVKRAILLLDDLAAKNGFIYTEIPEDIPPVEESDIPEEILNEEPEEIKIPSDIAPEVTDPFAALKGRVSLPFETKLKNGRLELREAYEEIKRHIVKYDVHDRASKKGETFSTHGFGIIFFSIVGKSLNIHYALTPSLYKDSPIPFRDDSAVSKYEKIPFNFKVTSELAIKRAKTLVDDVMKSYNVPLLKEEDIENDLYAVFKNSALIEQPIKNVPQEEDVIEEREEIKPLNPFDRLSSIEILSFSERLARCDSETLDIYNKLRNRCLGYGVKAYLSKKGESFRAHNQTYVLIKIVRKSLVLHFALDPQEYLNDHIPYRDNSKIAQYKNIPLSLKITSDLSVRRASKLIDDVMTRNGFTYTEITAPIPSIEEEEETFEPIVEEREEIKPVNPFDRLSSIEILSFSERLSRCDSETREIYTELRNRCLDYHVKGYLSKKGESFRAHNQTYVLFKIVRKSLVIYYALDPKDYADSPIPFKDKSEIGAYERLPMSLKITSDLSVRRASKLIDDVMTKNGFIYAPDIEEEPIVEEVEVVKETEEPIVKVINPFDRLSSIEILSFSERLSKVDSETLDAYRQIRERALSYNVKAYLSKKGETFRAHNKTYILIKIVRKSLVIYYALDPKDYADSPIPFKDKGEINAYEHLPMCLKITSDLAVRRALKLVDAVLTQNGFTYTPKEEIKVVEPKIKAVEVKEIEVPEIVNPFAHLANLKIPSFEERLSKLNKETKETYEEIRARVLSYGVKGYVSFKGESFRAHNKTYVFIKIVRKSIHVYFALDPKDYADSPIPVRDSGSKAIYEKTPMELKITSSLAKRRAIKLIDDCMSQNGYEIKETK